MMLHKSVFRLALLLFSMFAPVFGVRAYDQQTSFPMPAGLEDAVRFWKLIYTRYSTAQVVLFDPLDPGKIYTVLRAGDGEQGQAVIDKERARIAADYDLADDESRIRSQRRSKENILEGLKITGRYMTQMQSFFREEGLPAELAYWPMVESSFNVRAHSSVGAVGMWQFMPETGKKFKRVDTTVDERRRARSSIWPRAKRLRPI